MTNDQRPQRVTFFGCFLFLLGSLFFIYEYFARTSLDSLNAMPHNAFANSLHITPEQLSLIGAAYAIAYSVMQIPVGIILDRFGVRKVGTFAILWCAIGVLVFSFASSFYSAFIGRFFIGFGSAFAFILLLKIVLDWFPHRILGLVVGMTQILGVIGPILSNVPLAYALESVDYQWRIVFYFITVAGIILSVIFLIFARDRQSTKNILSIKEVALQTLSLFRYRQIIIIAIFAFFIYPAAELFGSLYGSSYLVSMGYSQISASSAIQFIWLGMGLGSPILGLCSDLMRKRKPVLYLAALIGVIASSIIVWLPNLHLHVYYLLFFLFGFATGAQAISFSVVVENVPRKLEATAMAFNNMSVVLGAAIIQILGGITLSKIALSSTHFSTQNYEVMLSISIIFFAVAFVFSLFFIKETHCQRQIKN